MLLGVDIVSEINLGSFFRDPTGLTPVLQFRSSYPVSGTQSGQEPITQFSGLWEPVDIMLGGLKSYQAAVVFTDTGELQIQLPQYSQPHNPGPLLTPCSPLHPHSGPRCPLHYGQKQGPFPCNDHRKAG